MESVDYASFVSFAVSQQHLSLFPSSSSASLLGGGGDQNDKASTPCSIGSLGMEREEGRGGRHSLARVDSDDDGDATHSCLLGSPQVNGVDVAFMSFILYLAVSRGGVHLYTSDLGTTFKN